MELAEFEAFKKGTLKPSPGLDAERLILQTTELILAEMEVASLTRTQVASKMGKSKAHVSQMLNGTRNMTLRTLASFGHTLNIQFSVAVESKAAHRGFRRAHLTSFEPHKQWQKASRDRPKARTQDMGRPEIAALPLGEWSRSVAS